MKTAVVTGITGQDGAYLASHLLKENYRVIGAFRRTSSVSFWRLKELGVEDNPNLELVEHDLTDPGSSIRLLRKYSPDECYNLAAQSFVGVSFDQPYTTSQITGIGALNLLEAIRIVSPDTRFYQASTSEMFGKVDESPQTELTRFHPRSPYGVAKLFAHWSTVNFRESYGLFASSGILFNHESPLRGFEFVTRKITHAAAAISMGQMKEFSLGNLSARRDWGYAGDYVKGIHAMLQTDNPDTFILATGTTASVREFAKLAFQAVDIELEFSGSIESEVGVDRRNNDVVVRVDSTLYRPAEVDALLGDATKAREELGWVPEMSLEQLAKTMVEADMRRLSS